MKLSAEEARNVIYEDHNDWESETVYEVTGSTRWSIVKKQVFKHIPSGKFYLFIWSEGATENQDEQPFEFVKEYEPVEVSLQEVTVLEWRPV